MSIILEGNQNLIVGGRMVVLGDPGNRLTAWAENYVRSDPSQLAWCLGRFVEADNPNGNGHIFPLKDLEDFGMGTIANKPLNMLHHENYIVGAYSAAEMIYPNKESADDVNGHPYVESLSYIWKHIYPDEFAAVQKAHAEGSLFYSMEASAETLTFVDYGVTVPYMGRYHESYPTKDMKAKRILNKPHFGGGAIIIPPVRPGWSGADIKSLDAFLHEQPEAAEAVFDGLKEEFAHLQQDDWEHMMCQLVKLAADSEMDTPTVKPEDHPVDPSGVDVPRIEAAVAEILAAIGEDGDSDPMGS